MADDCEGRAGQNKHRWNPEAENTVCKDSQGERTFSERYLSVMSNLANLNLCTAVMQRSVRVGVLYPGQFVAIIIFWWLASMPNYIITRRGLACVAYPCKEAMREPDIRDRRGGTNSHVFFYFQTLNSVLTLNWGVRRQHLDF